MQEYRVTKYDPAHRDGTGAYRLVEWTEASDIGRQFGDKLLTQKEYERVEDTYVETALAFAEEAELDHLRVVGLEKRWFDERLADEDWSHLCKTEFRSLELREDGLVSQADLGTVVRAVLRGFLWCRLEIVDRFFLHFGYDYYMYVGSSGSTEAGLKKALALGLHSEAFLSPHRWRGNHSKWLIYRDGDEGATPEEQEISLERDEIRSLAAWSVEHPADVAFVLDSQAREWLSGERGLLLKPGLWQADPV